MSPRITMSPRIHKATPVQVELPLTAAAPLPPMTDLMTKSQLVARHPHLLSLNRVTWALRCRAVNGLSGAVFDSPALSPCLMEKHRVGATLKVRAFDAQIGGRWEGISGQQIARARPLTPAHDALDMNLW